VSAGKIKNRLNKTLFNYCMLKPEERKEHCEAIFAGKENVQDLI